MWFEEVEVGNRTELGSHCFEASEIIAFARAYDPQPFHLSEEAAAATHFGRLCASGWHTAGIWMRLMVEHRRRLAGQAKARGETMARLGPSPGFRNLVWARPVHVEDVIRYSSTVTSKRLSGSRPGWGLVFHRNEGINQRGEPAFAFDGCVFWECRGKEAAMVSGEGIEPSTT